MEEDDKYNIKYSGQGIISTVNSIVQSKEGTNDINEYEQISEIHYKQQNNNEKFETKNFLNSNSKLKYKSDLNQQNLQNNFNDSCSPQDSQREEGNLNVINTESSFIIKEKEIKTSDQEKIQKKIVIKNIQQSKDQLSNSEIQENNNEILNKSEKCESGKSNCDEMNMKTVINNKNLNKKKENSDQSNQQEEQSMMDNKFYKGKNTKAVINNSSSNTFMNSNLMNSVYINNLQGTRRMSVANMFGKKNIQFGKKNALNSPAMIKDLFKDIKIRQFAIDVAGQLPSRLYKNLNDKQFHLIGDKGSRSIGEVSTKKSTIFKFIIFQKIEELVINFLEKLPLFYPFKYNKLVWDIFIVFLVSLLMAVIPLEISVYPDFQIISQTIVFDFIYVLLIIDLIFTFNTAVIENGKLITKRRERIKIYLNNNFLWDLITMILLLIGNYSQNQNVKWCSLAIFHKYYSFQNLGKLIEESFHLSFKSRNMVRLIKLLIFMVYVTHIIACTWIYIVQQTFYLEKKNNWMFELDLVSQHWTRQYLYSYYFAVTTTCTVGYGDISPDNDLEIFVCIVCMFVSCGIFAYVVNIIGCIFQDIQIQDNEIKNKVYAMNNYLKRKNISFYLQQEIRQYLEYYWQQQKQADMNLEQQMINQLPDQLKEQLLFEANKIIIKDAPIFKKNFSSKLISRCVQLIEEKAYQPEQIIINKNKDNNIYFIEKGEVEIYLDKYQKGKNQDYFSLQKLEKGNFFGYYQFFTDQMENYKVRSNSFTQLLAINRDKFLKLIKEFQDDQETFCLIKDKLLYSKDHRMIRKLCESCGKDNHDFSICKAKIEEELNQSDLDEYEQQEIFTQSSQYDLINDSQDSSMIELNQEESQILDIFSKDTIKEVNSSCSNFNNLGVQQEDSVVISQKSQKTKKSKKSQRSLYSNQIKKSQIIQNQRKNTNDDKFNLYSPFSGRSEHKNAFKIGDFSQVSSSQFNIQQKPYIKINNQKENQVQQNCSISLCKESLQESNESSPKIKTGQNKNRNTINEEWTLQTENQLNIKQDFQFCNKDQQLYEQNVDQKQREKKVSKFADKSQNQQQIQKINKKLSETKNSNNRKISNLKILIDENNSDFNSENNTNPQKDNNKIYNYNIKNDDNNNYNGIDINGNGSTKNTSNNGQYQKQVSQNLKNCTNNNTNVFNQQKNRELNAKKTFFMNSRSREPSKLNSPQISYNNSKQTMNLRRETPKNSNFKIMAFPQIGKFVNTNNQLKIQENEQQTYKMGQSNCKMIQSKKQNPLQGWMNKYIQQQQQKQQQQCSDNQIQQQNYYNNEMLFQNQHYFYSDNYQNFINFQNDFFGVDDIDQMKIMRLYFTRYNYNQVISQYMNLKLTKNVRKRASITIQKNKFFKMNGGIGNCNLDATNQLVDLDKNLQNLVSQNQSLKSKDVNKTGNKIHPLSNFGMNGNNL